MPTDQICLEKILIMYVTDINISFEGRAKLFDM